LDHIKLGTRYYRDPAVLAANKRTGGQAELLFLRALAQCGADETEGHIPEDALAFLGIKNAARVAAVLVEEKLWMPNGDGWYIRSWEKWQSEHDILARRRKAERERKRAQRLRESQDGPSPDPGPSRDRPEPASRDVTPPNARDYRDRDVTEEAKASSTPRSDVDRLCAHLADRIEGNGSKRPTVTKRWQDAARLLLDRDKRTEEQVHAAIDWCQDDDFWRSNILSMPKLRERYDQLRLAAQRTNGDRPRPGNPYLDDLRAAQAAATALYVVPELEAR
jgi:hypothetical protein